MGGRDAAERGTASDGGVGPRRAPAMFGADLARPAGPDDGAAVRRGDGGPPGGGGAAD